MSGTVGKVQGESEHRHFTQSQAIMKKKCGKLGYLSLVIFIVLIQGECAAGKEYL